MFLLGIPYIGPAIAAVMAVVPSWLWKWIGVFVLAAAIFIAGDIRGTRIANEKCAAEVRKSQEQATKIDRRADVDTRADETSFAKEAATQKAIDDAEIKRLNAELAKRPAAHRCDIDDADARSLRYRP